MLQRFLAEITSSLLKDCNGRPTALCDRWVSYERRKWLLSRYLVYARKKWWANLPTEIDTKAYALRVEHALIELEDLDDKSSDKE